MRTLPIVALATLVLAIPALGESKSDWKGLPTTGKSIQGGFGDGSTKRILSDDSGDSGSDGDGVSEMLAESLRTYRPQHPSLLLSASRIQELKNRAAYDATLESWIAHVGGLANEALYVVPAAWSWDSNYGPTTNNIEVARTALLRIQALALSWRLTGNEKHAIRARTELLALAAIHWGVDFDILATAEATHALSVGLDWLYPKLNVKERYVVRMSIGRATAEMCRQVDSGVWWTRIPYNANSVMSGALILGGLALVDGSRGPAYEALIRGIPTIQMSIASLGSDGGWLEGYTYWDYATRYMSYAIASMDSVLGDDFGLADSVGYSKAGDFKLVMGGPTFVAVNFADAVADAHPSAHMLYLAQRFNRPDWAACERNSVAQRGPTPMHVVWYTDAGAEADIEAQSPSRIFNSGAVAVLRNSLTNPNAASAALRVGDNSAVHCYPELGNFVYENQGVRWAIDFGYTDGGFRAKTSSQNVLVFNEQDQLPNGKAMFSGFDSSNAGSYSVANLGGANGLPVGYWLRGVALVRDGSALVRDEFRAAAGTLVKWKMHTCAGVEVEGNLATLSQNGQKMRMVVLEPAGAVFQASQVGAKATIPSDQLANEIVVALSATGRNQVIRVAFVPAGSGAAMGSSLPSGALYQWAEWFAGLN